ALVNCVGRRAARAGAACPPSRADAWGRGAAGRGDLRSQNWAGEVRSQSPLAGHPIGTSAHGHAPVGAPFWGKVRLMSQRFNAPPGWQVPEGFVPPTGWQPDPSWPAAPAGWNFWVDDAAPQAAPGAAPGAPAADAPAAGYGPATHGGYGDPAGYGA